MEHKELIKERMLRRASRMWAIDEVYDESSFDPLVRILISALAAESESIYHEMDQVQDRVAQKLMNQLIPHIHGGVQPGYSVVIINPTDSVACLPANYKFLSRVRNEFDALRELQFISLQEVSLFKGGVKYMLSNSAYYQMTDYRFKSRIESDVLKGVTVDKKEVLLGIEIPENTDGLNTFRLFFDFKENTTLRDSFYRQLKNANFYFNDERLEVNFGLLFDEEDELTIDWGSSKSELSEIKKRVLSFYDRQFVAIKRTLKGEQDFISNGAQNDGHTCWLRICFSEDFDSRILSSVNCFANALPVVNLTEREKVFKSSENLSVISLQDEEAFFALDVVEGDDGVVYEEYGAQNGGEWENGTFLLRRDGVAGMSTENANEAINFLIGKLRNESAAFAMLDKGKFSDDLKVLGQIVSRLQQSVTQKKRYHSPVYMFLKYREIADTIFVKYYTTAGKILKGIKPNTPILPYKGASIQQAGGYFITPMTGARNVLNADEQLYNNRYMMLSGGRIVTKKDIKALVCSVFGEMVEQVEIDKGLIESRDSQIGFVRTIDIKLTIKREIAEDDTIVFEGREVLYVLEERGSNIYPYCLFINGMQIFKQ
ncbi:type VI secretion system baseplate subunit TssF [Ancylomarina sp. 16SWW S1-10-2]|uniref:type VI secretion system baseplate subunit TssF n=1 Tax=Ancylomarina sp. 16SWW S1-10-2 TaxID=2499681 RepID=UPI0012ADD6E1|nr:type VI secretion system baseplate subunit TssF [Ancylomarina sp. 16SWW S1-10-2]MRT94777.1 hypothetical protein [Ancylomarina sp. 16SWW S1-10-2]